jgi:DNA-directed RNA polymerase subunit L
MSESTYQDFHVDITNIKTTELNNNGLVFEIKGNKEYGLNKSFINGIRRILLTEIKTVAFNDNDIVIEENSGALHNEFLKSRIALIPLYINPIDFHKSYLFELDINEYDEPLINITTDLFNIYELNKTTKDLIEKQSLMADIPDEENILLKLNNVNKEYYDLKNKLSDKKKKDIFRPFSFNKKDNYFLITELKSTNSDMDNEKIKLYCSPSVGISRENARFQNLSTVVYTFKKDKEYFKQVLKDKIEINKIKKKNDIEAFSKSLELSESERYFHKDNNEEPYWFNFEIVSNHIHTPKEVLIQSIDILHDKFINIEDNIKNMLKQSDLTIGKYNIKRFKNDQTYQISIDDEDDTTGSIIQSHAVNKYITNDTFIQICGYKKPHPLIKKIVINFMILPTDYTEQQKIQYICEFLINVIVDIQNIILMIKSKIESSI